MDHLLVHALLASLVMERIVKVCLIDPHLRMLACHKPQNTKMAPEGFYPGNYTFFIYDIFEIFFKMYQ